MDARLFKVSIASLGNSLHVNLCLSDNITRT